MSSSGDTGRVPEPNLKVRKQRSSAFGRVLGSLIMLGLAIAAIVAAAGFYGYTRFTASGPLELAKVHIVEAGQSQQEIGEALEKDGVVTSGGLFAAAAYLNAARGQVLKPGEYEFPAGSSMEQVMAIIASGRAITYKLTIPEGWTSQMALARVNENDILTGDAVQQPPPEGSIMPDTYVFRRGMTRQKLVEDMQEAQKQLVSQLWEERPETVHVKTREELVTLASIVEKETGVAEERPVVASVFINRLKQGIRLQSDPTIIYGLVAGKGKLERGLTKDDVASDTPYNTYKIAGLPPGPIANPGRAALEAVLNPAETKYVYFVANGTGGHAFAETLTEHNANVAKWRSLETGQAAVVTTEAAPADAAADAMPEVQVEPEPQQPAAPAGTATDTAAQPAPVPAPAAAGEAQPPAAKPEESQQVIAAEPAKPAEAAKPAVAATPDAAAKPAEGAVASKTVLQPGTLVKVANRLVPIPRQKPKK